MKQQRVRSLPLGVLTGLSALVLAVGGATAWWILQPPRPAPAPTTTPPVSTAPTTPTAAQSSAPQPDATSPGPVAEQQVQIYWIQSNANQVKLVPRPVTLETTSSSKGEVLKVAMQRLLAGPADTTVVSTTIPSKTQLNALEVKADGIHVDLSQDFTVGGGSTSMQGRVAQILYTATSLDSQAQVWLSVDGKPLTVLGGEGLLLEQPITRQNFEENFTL